ncbi:MAG: hypothetical protein ABIH65_00460 [Nanoarchaeota archaeon]
MKKILIQDRFSTDSHIDSLKNLLELEFKDKQIEFNLVFCLRGAKFPIIDYNLIISHPPIFDNCCVPLIEQAVRKNVPVVFRYHTKYPHGNEIEAIAQNLGMDINYSSSGNWREVYGNIIKKFIEKD